MNAPLVVATERPDVILRELTPDDADAYFEAVNTNRDHLSQFSDQTSANYPTLESVKKSLEEPTNPKTLRWGIWDRETFVGGIDLMPNEEGSELRYWLDGRHTHKGYATVAVHALSQYAWRHFEKVQASVIEDNEASVRVLERSGFKQTAKETGILIFELVTTELIPNPDFAFQLEKAFAHPLARGLKGSPPTSVEDLDHRERYLSSCASLPEHIKIRSLETPLEEYEVATEDPAQYPLLLAQAMQKLKITNGLADPGIVITPTLKRVAEHEIAHGEMAHLFGLESRYGVRILYDSDENTWALSPFHSVVGDYAGVILLTRLQEAAISVAPEDPSPADLHSARLLGYANREEVLDRLCAVLQEVTPQNKA